MGVGAQVNIIPNKLLSADRLSWPATQNRSIENIERIERPSLLSKGSIPLRSPRRAVLFFYSKWRGMITSRYRVLNIRKPKDISI